MPPPPATSVAQAIEEMAVAARALLESLDAGQRAQANLPFEQEGERTTWFYTPTDHGGLCLRDMDGPQQRLAFRLLATGLSESGYNTAATIVGLENVLDRREGFRAEFVSDAGRGRDPNFYYVAVFGEPGAETGWGWRFGGHHVSVSYTLVGSAPRYQPLFFGANPASYPIGSQLMRPLAPEMDLGRALLHALDGEQRRQAVLSSAAPVDIVTGNRPSFAAGDEPPPQWSLMRGVPVEAREGMDRRIAAFADALGMNGERAAALALPGVPRGVPGSALAGTKAAGILHDLVDQFRLRLPPPIAESAEITPERLADVHFAWAGSDQPGEPHYWRLHGPRFLVEYDCVQNGANHVHTVWRDPVADFGRDLLAEHYAAAH